MCLSIMGWYTREMIPLIKIMRPKKHGVLFWHPPRYWSFFYSKSLDHLPHTRITMTPSPEMINPFKVMIFYRRRVLELKWHILISVGRVVRQWHVPYISCGSNLCTSFGWSTSTSEDGGNTISHSKHFVFIV